MELGLKLVVKWSQTRIIVAACIPLVLSLVVGFWYMAAHNFEGAAGNAWAIWSYIDTAGACVFF